jgi:hypothetical protein
MAFINSANIGNNPLGPILRESDVRAPQNAGEQLEDTSQDVRGEDLQTDENATLSDKYKERIGAPIQLYSYPQELGTPEQPHWLKIQIRVRGQNSQYSSGLTEYSASKSERRMDYGDNLTTGAVVGGASGVANTNTGGVFNPVKKLFGAVRGAAVGATVAALAGENKLYTLQAVLGFGIQEPPQARYGTQWAEADLGSVLGGGQQSSFDILKGVALEAYKRNINVGKLGELGDFTNRDAVAAIEKSQGKVRNPYKEQIFKEVDFRIFSFKFTLLPASIDEAKGIINVINLLKRNMLPEVAPNSFYLIYPSEFSLTYMYKGAPNMNVHQFGDCVLTDLDVRYGGQDFVTFRNTSGVPAEFEIGMTFKEIVPITADRAVSENL